MAMVRLSALALFSLAAGAPEGGHAHMWRRFLSMYNRSYDDAEEVARLEVFKANLLLVEKLNAEMGTACPDLLDGQGCAFALNKFADVAPADFKRRLGVKRLKAPAAPSVAQALAGAGVVEKAVDWRTKGVLSPVKNQGKCGGCWAFSAVEQIESSLAQLTGSMKRLSTEQLIDCDKTDSGCDGGDLVSAYEFLLSEGLATAEDYPDTSSEGSAGECKPVQKSVKLVSHSYAVPPCTNGPSPCDKQDEPGLAQALAKGPVSVCVNWGPGWQFYKSGIYNRTCGNSVEEVDHCMQLVGYDMSAELPYWIVRNSMGADWGLDGYIYLAMGKNRCGIANEAVVVEVATMETDLIV